MREEAQETARDGVCEAAMKKPPVRNCDECSNFLTSGYETHIGVCRLRHKPRWIEPKDYNDRDWGFKRRCEDYVERSEK